MSALAAVAAAVAVGAPVVHTDGRIGPFRIDVTTEAQLRARLGRPARVDGAFFAGRKAPVGRRLVYRRGPGCATTYSFSRATGTLSDFASSSPQFVTARGSHVGTAAKDAARRERRKLVPGCGTGLYIHLRWDERHVVVLTIRRGKVDGIVFLGPHSTYDEGLC